MKEVTHEEAIKLLEEIGHLSNVTVPVENKVGEFEHQVVLNDGFVYNPYKKFQVGSFPTSAENAERAMGYIKGEFRIYSGYYSWATGDYKII